ncbi:MAG: hypothetical protein K6T63_03410 [Alicyclobacillus herbarius]|uniref:hypothetical protein n=1 Tax=Alicyclobacillus herbarius TaxID=122960 RepID=UPI00041B42C9|nr:hypothetical protein [Alicyclobacillus herbarius]MCL6631656.1 hypothetical protein [Alicyclobacillus herbarius]
MDWVRGALLWLVTRKRRWHGLMAGCLLWVLWMLFGFWAVLGLVFLAAAGYVVGRFLEERQSWKDIVDKLLSERYGE